MPKLTVNDGAVINYRVDDLTPQWLGERQTILMVHRQGENLHFLTPMAAVLAAKLRVVRMDMRGRGESTWPPNSATLSGGKDESTLFERQADDAIALIDHLGIDKFHYWGGGGGGTTGMIVATRYPERLKSLTLVAAPCRVPREVVEPWYMGEKSIAAAIEKYGVAEWTERALWPKDLDQVEADSSFAAWNLQEKKKLTPLTRVATLVGCELVDLADRLGEITVPTMVVTEETTQTPPLEHTKFVHASIPNSKLVIYGMGKGAHTVAAERCAQDVLSFIQSLS